MKVSKLIFLAPLLIAAKPAPEPLNYGSTPTFEAAVAVAEAAIRQHLVDPDSAKFQWPFNFVAGSLKAIFSKRSTGYWTCGRVNSRNKMGGFAGESWVQVVVFDGSAIMVDIGEDQQNDLVNTGCEYAIKKGQLPAAPVSAQLIQTRPSAFPVGIQFQPTVVGALIITVLQGSIAERVGLKVGHLIKAVDGIPLSSSDPAAVIEAMRPKTGHIEYLTSTGERFVLAK